MQSGDVKSDLLNCFEIVFDHCFYLGYFLERRRNYLSLPFFLKCLLKVIARGQIFLSSKNCLIRRSLCAVSFFSD